MKRTFLNRIAAILMAVAVVALFSCNAGKKDDGHDHDGHDHGTEHSHDIDGHEHDTNEHDGDTPHWSYEGEDGPVNWASLCDGFSDCSGTAQSPIDIADFKACDKLSGLALENSEVAVPEIVNNGHTVQLNLADGNTFTFNEVTYTMAQFHFHSPSEHTVSGSPYPAEIHFVHLSADKQIAVVGLMVEEGDESPFFADFLTNFPGEEGKHECGKKLDPSTLMPNNKAYWHYTGSLTTPPCTEGVSWFVLQNAITASKEQITALTAMMPKNNARPVQALNDREIKSVK